MTATYRCDHCDEEITGEPFHLEYPIDLPDDYDDDDDGLVGIETVDFCSTSCLASWAMVQTLDGGEI